MLKADGSDPTRLTNNPAGDWNPAWSPDSSRIAFVSGRDGGYEVYVTDADGSHQTNLTHNPEDDRYPDWSP
jgi:Tol biopolymer transport system component